jgi:IS30 family transposase
MEKQSSTTSSTEPPGDRGRPEQIHQIIFVRDEWEMSWGQIAAKLKRKRSTVQTAYHRWEKHGAFKRGEQRRKEKRSRKSRRIVRKLNLRMGEDRSTE